MLQALEERPKAKEPDTGSNAFNQLFFLGIFQPSQPFFLQVFQPSQPFVLEIFEIFLSGFFSTKANLSLQRYLNQGQIFFLEIFKPRPTFLSGGISTKANLSFQRSFNQANLSLQRSFNQGQPFFLDIFKLRLFLSGNFLNHG